MWYVPLLLPSLLVSLHFSPRPHRNAISKALRYPETKMFSKFCYNHIIEPLDEEVYVIFFWWLTSSSKLTVTSSEKAFPEAAWWFLMISAMRFRFPPGSSLIDLWRSRFSSRLIGLPRWVNRQQISKPWKKIVKDESERKVRYCIIYLHEVATLSRSFSACCCMLFS